MRIILVDCCVIGRCIVTGDRQAMPLSCHGLYHFAMWLRTSLGNIHRRSFTKSTSGNWILCELIVPVADHRHLCIHVTSAEVADCGRSALICFAPAVDHVDLVCLLRKHALREQMR